MYYYAVYIIFFLLSVPIFSQELTETPDTQVILPELGKLKLDYLMIDLSSEELYRLASFYLSEQLYHQASELYGQYLAKIDPVKNVQRTAAAHYNRALALFSLTLYESALPEFLNAYYYNESLYDALRMAGTVYFLQKNKEKSLEIWQQYLSKNTETSPEREAIEKAVLFLSDPAFRFDPPKKKQKVPQKTWPFLNPEIIPNPDATYQKKRII